MKKRRVKARKPKRKLIFDKKGITAFAEQLKKVRKNKGLTQNQLAFEAGLTLSQIARIETAQTNPTLSTIFAICRALEMEDSISEMFDFKLPK